MRSILLAITTLFATICLAQDSTRVVVEAGETFSQVITPKVKYRFPAFRPGQVLTKDKTIYNSQLNYNLFSGELEFISPTGDTLAIADQLRSTIDRITVDSISFFYDHGYLEVIKETPRAFLCKKQRFEITNREKIGAYDMSSPTSAIDSYTSIRSEGGNWFNLTARENVTFDLKTTYFFGNKYHQISPFNKKTVDKSLLKKKAETEKYLKEHPVNFDYEKDVKALFSFMQNLN